MLFCSIKQHLSTGPASFFLATAQICAAWLDPFSFLFFSFRISNLNRNGFGKFVSECWIRTQRPSLFICLPLTYHVACLLMRIAFLCFSFSSTERFKSKATGFRLNLC